MSSATPSSTNSKTIPNPLGVHALTWVGGWSHEQCRHACQRTKEAGFSVIEIPIFDSFQIDVPDTIQVLQDYGLTATVSLGLNFEQDINNEDPEIVAQGLQILRRALDIVHQLGGTYMGGVIYSALGKYSVACTAKARANVVASLKILAQEAAAKGITLGLEAVNRYETNLLNTVEQAVQLIREIDEPNIRVHLDTYHMNIEEYDLESPILQHAQYIGYVHIGASHRGGLGTGNIDFDQFFGALAKIDYQGVITFESFSSEIVDGTLTKALCIWRNLWHDNLQMATESRKYIEEKIQQAHKRKRQATEASWLPTTASYG
ncbi:ribulose 3-epimerase [Seminavis robusta]|uniref:Ribulose 3-epimerase n=1 Tax=Seminavis robusta TaxID=568900 RepID=A0A9N8F0E3_9STRA|nr:ribulose 3-epimerase [Seminavis robusta]|eukprot:Sro2398_g326130.1 ribulose 3-epimerase (319) ;mRNA; f:8741-9697